MIRIEGRDEKSIHCYEFMMGTKESCDSWMALKRSEGIETFYSGQDSSEDKILLKPINVNDGLQ